MMKQVCGAFLLVLLGLSGLAQESAAPKVAIPLIANGSHHRPISITVKSLAITDQKIPVTGASLLRGADLPLELGVLIDTSTSQRDAYTDDTMKATQQFADKTIRRLEDRVFFLQFATTPQATGWLKKEQLQSIPIKVRIGGGTALYDALAMACKQRMGPRDWREPTRRVLVLISDGMDDRSQITRDEAAAEVLKAGVMVFTINTEDTGMGLNSGEKVMKNFAEQTGGESFSPRTGEDMPKVFASIQTLIDGMYYLSYVPPEAAKTAVHEVEVKPTAKEKFKLSYAREYLWNQ